MAAGRGTYIDGLLSLAGGSNVFGNDPAYPETTLEGICNAKPGVVLLPSEPFPFQEKHKAELRDAGISSSIELVDGDDYCWHGSRTIRGLERVSGLRGSLKRSE